jgi:hypothetical protein
MSTSFGVWVAALLTLAAYSFLYKENRWYRAAEHIYVGAGAGYSLVMGYTNVLTKGWTPLVEKGQVHLIIPLVLGLLLFARFSRNIRWMSRIPLAVLVGMGAAIAMRGAVQAQFISQVSATMVPLTNLNNLILVTGVVGVLCYFFFTFPKHSAVQLGASYGRWMIMITMGAAFGNAVMGRISLFIGVLQFMFGQWIKIIK